MAEWQPARFVLAHDPGDMSQDQLAALARMTIRVRPMGTNFIGSRLCPVEGSQVYEVHPEDCDRIWGDGPKVNQLICEHEILTD